MHLQMERRSDLRRVDVTIELVRERAKGEPLAARLRVEGAGRLAWPLEMTLSGSVPHGLFRASA